MINVICQCGCGYYVDSKQHLQFHYYDMMREIEKTQEVESEIEILNENNCHIHSNTCFCAEVW